jgi:hypothetical protein
MYKRLIDGDDHDEALFEARDALCSEGRVNTCIALHFKLTGAMIQNTRISTIFAQLHRMLRVKLSVGLITACWEAHPNKLH